MRQPVLVGTGNIGKQDMADSPQRQDRGTMGDCPNQDETLPDVISKIALSSSEVKVTEAEKKPLVPAGDQTSLVVTVNGEPATRTNEDADETDNVSGIVDDSHLLQDRGWAWLVCLGNFYSHLVTGGFERSDGIMFLEFKDKFHESAQLTAWPAAVCSAIRLMMGPLSMAMCNRFSARTATMVGAFIFAAGLILSSFAPNVVFLIFSYGLVQGVGRGLVYSPGLVIVGLYFNRRRGLGVGLACAGVGVGTFIFPPLVEWLVQQYGFQGAFLILAGLALNTCISAALYRPLFVHHSIVLGSRDKDKDEEVALCSKEQNSNSKAQSTELTEVEHINSGCSLYVSEELTAISNSKSSVGDQNNKVQVTSTQNQTCESTSSQTLQPASSVPMNARRSLKSRVARFSRSVMSICFPTELQKKDSPKRKLIEWSLLKIPAFFFYCISICLFTMAFKSAFTFLPALSESKGVSPAQSAYLLSISGVMDTIGRILAGAIFDTSCMRPLRPVLYNGVIFLIVVLSFVSPFLESFLQFALLFGLYGMLTGTYVSQKSVILVDILGQDKLSSSFGLMVCFQGIGTFIGPPLSGLLKDIFGRYHEAFFMGGAAMGVASILMTFSNICMHLQKRRLKAESRSTVKH